VSFTLHCQLSKDPDKTQLKVQYSSVIAIRRTHKPLLGKTLIGGVHLKK